MPQGVNMEEKIQLNDGPWTTLLRLAADQKLTPPMSPFVLQAD